MLANVSTNTIFKQDNSNVTEANALLTNKDIKIEFKRQGCSLAKTI